MTDLTKIEKPFFLLTDEEKAALKVWPHGWELRTDYGWTRLHHPVWAGPLTYRAALVAKENEQCQAFIEPATGATINGLYGSGAGAPDAVANSHPDAVLAEAARRANQ